MTVSELLRIADHLDPKGQQMVRKAYERAATAHDGQHRLSGEDYVNHPLEVAAILADLELDAETISAALLHDTVEDTKLTADERQRDEREKLVSDLREILARELEKLGIQADITGRPKHIYSVWQKMTRESKDFSEIYDLSAIRVQVDSVRDCYGVLGVVHSLWKPMPGRFKDYIAMPKSNGYQSLHTTVITHTGEPIEIQIRTHEMHRVAEFGVAAHWTYKEGGKDASFDQKLSWLRSLLEWQSEVGDAESFLDTVKVDLFEDEVYVFTPRGDVINLPADSTPVDFAYRIHTEVGHHCIGAKVHVRMVPLDYELKNGEIVEILTSKGPHGPSRGWLNFVNSASAKERIRKWFKSQRREENVAKGRDLLDKELHRMHRVSLGDLPDQKLYDVASRHKFNS